MNKTILASAVVGVFALSGAISVASANSLTIVDTAGIAVAENIGDPGGTHYPSVPTPGASAGSGLPTALGGWPIDTGFGPDPSFPPGGGALGIAGWDGAYLALEHAGDVTFQNLGHGDATNHDIFQVFTAGSWLTIFDNTTSPVTGASGTPTPLYTDALGSSYTAFFGAGLIPFRFENLTTPGSAVNDGINNPRAEDGVSPGYFLGIDPYLSNTVYPSVDHTGAAAFAGFTDLKGPGDHDYEDLVVRVSVPEPGSLMLLMLGLLGFGALRRRSAASASEGLLA